MTPREVSATCATCHNRGEHALWDGSQHDARNCRCMTCHSVHAPKSGTAQLKAATQPQLCATCHRDKVAKLDRSGHMPVREGKMQCSTCHNPHGATNVKLLRKGDSIAELCTSCHADKRGPVSVGARAGPRRLRRPATIRTARRTSACSSPSRRFSVSAATSARGTRARSTTRRLIGAGATPSIRIYARSCVTCHANIHGSNHPSGQRFIR